MAYLENRSEKERAGKLRRLELIKSDPEKLSAHRQKNNKANQKYRLAHPEKMRARCAKRRAEGKKKTPPEVQRKSNAKIREKLTDGYICDQLGLKTADTPQFLIQLKRHTILLHRAINSQKHNQPNQHT